MNEPKSINNRYICFDILKCICAFMVICIHKGFGIGAGPMRAICRIALPIFFMISGFFFVSNYKKNRIQTIEKKLLRNYMVLSFIYIVYSIIHNLLKGISISEYLNGMFSIKNILYFLLLNYHPLIGVIWYIGALLYTYIIINFIYKNNQKKCLYILVPVLIVIGLMLGAYSGIIFNESLNFVYSRNFVFIGIPSFALGMIINENKETLNNIKININIVLSIVFVATTLLEYFYFKSKYDDLSIDVFASTFPLAINVFVIFIKVYSTRQTVSIENYLAQIGKDYSAGIYYIHIIVKNILDLFLDGFYLYKLLAPVIIFAVCIMLIYLYKTLIKKVFA